MNPMVEDSLMHYGIKRRSGRYPWGSGDDPHQHGSRDFLGRVDELRKQGFTFTDEDGKTYSGDTAIAKSMGLSTTQFRTEISLAKDERRMLDVARAKSLRDDGKGPTEIGKEMGVNESTVRSWLNEESESRMKQAMNTADFIRDQIEKKGMIDVGTGVERELNISKEKLKEALYILEREGYPIYKGGIPQATNPGQQTNQKVICPKGTQHKDIYQFDKIHPLNEDNYISRDDGKTFEKKFHYPSSMDSKRLMVRYNEDGGVDKDGIVELRRDVADLSLGNSRYSQVRILVDDTHYIKGMAVYSDNMPDGVDVVFNTNKKRGTPKMDVLKEIKKDPDNPFGSAIKDAEQGGQYWYDSKTGKKCKPTDPNAKLGLINKRADEGDWSDWKDALPSQFLGKQPITMIKKQLGLAKADKQAEYDEICSLTNPTVKKHLLQKFADECDSAAVHLQASALPGQKYHVIIPNNTLKENEVYAPGYESGTKLALIRYPHGGTFEIPICTVNNKNSLGKKLIGTDPIDAICINHKVAERLSGADFDGDTVMCIPTHDAKGRVKISSTPALKDLEGFDSKSYQADKIVKDNDGTVHAYRNGREFRVMKNTGTQMGVISNLITDMTLLGASQDELARAVKHSMVVIDAEKHKLDYKQSEIDNGIAALHKKYQGKSTGGAATILSRAKGETSVLKRQGTPKINIKGTDHYDPTKPEGSLLYKVADNVEYQVARTNKRTGEVTTVTKQRTQKSTKMAETDDAYTLLSTTRHPKEVVYADHANFMKDLANRARIEMAGTGKIAYSATAKATYKAEVDSLLKQLNTAQLNTTRERAAQRKANAEVSAKKKANPDMKPDEVKKASQQALTKYRNEVGSVSRDKRAIKITDREWEAIQAGAISENVLKQILNNTDVDNLRQRATPRTTTSVSSAKVSKAKAMRASNYSLAEIAKALGVSTSTVSNLLKGTA
jgi:predicted transcriptional regulator